MRGGVKSMYRKNPLGKKTCKLSDICCFALYRIDVSLRKVPNSFILILPAYISYAGSRWEHSGVFASVLYGSTDYIRRLLVLLFVS
jgi:hypothetical protein